MTAFGEALPSLSLLLDDDQKEEEERRHLSAADAPIALAPAALAVAALANASAGGGGAASFPELRPPQAKRLPRRLAQHSTRQ